MSQAIAINTFRSPIFDRLFIGAIPILAILTAYTAFLSPEYFDLILLLDLSLLGYHHVISTYTRLAFSTLSLNENRFLLFVLPILVLSFVLICIYLGSVWLIATIYLHWQWWHYTRQSEGVSKAITMKTKSIQGGNEKLNRFLFYAAPISCFLSMSSRQESTFLFMPIYTLPIPIFVAQVLLALPIFIFLTWLGYQLQAIREQKISLPLFLYLISHYVIYLVAYVLIDDITMGWLCLNICPNF